MKRFWALAISWAMVILMIGLAACSPATPTATTKPAPATSPAPAPAPAPAPSPAPKPAEPIVLGAPVSLGYAVGRDGVRAAQIAVDEINAAGGVLVGGVKRPLKLAEIDSRAMAPGVPTADSLLAYQKLIADSKPSAIALSAERSEVALASMDLMAKNKMIQMIPGAKSPAITQKVADDYNTYKYNFRLTINVASLYGYVPAHLQMVNQQFGFNKLVFIAEDTAFARGTIGAIEKPIKDAGWSVLSTEYIPLGTTDYSIPLLKAKNAGAQVIYTVFSSPEVSVLVDQYNTAKIPALLMGIASPLVGPNAWKTYGNKIEGVCLIAECGTVPFATVPESVKFYDSYVKRYGDGPEIDSVPAPAYDAVYILAAAFEKANSLDADALVPVLEKTDRKGAIGRIRFDKTHQTVYGTDPKENALYGMVQWQAPGKRVVVWPKDAAETPIKLPSWMSK
jgi:branched-chain amino acid transport system substrate-binding protein